MKLKSFCFTLIELIVAMGVFAILMVALMQFFSSAQSLWVKSSQNTEIYQNARVLMEIITRDLQCIAYNNNDDSSGIYPFWFEYDGRSDSSSRLNFISTTDLRSSNAKSPVSIVKYAWANGMTSNEVYLNGFNGTLVDSDAANQINWFVRSCTSDTKFDSDTAQAAPMYNYMSYPRRAVLTNTPNSGRAAQIFKCVGVQQTTENFQYVVPYVVNFKATCYGNIATGTKISPLQQSSATESVSNLPQVIVFEFSMLDKNSWQKWITMGGHRSDPDSDSTDVKAYRLSKQLDFSFTVYINNRLGQ